jgi:hypothetical protein
MNRKTTAASRSVRRWSVAQKAATREPTAANMALKTAGSSVV